MSYSIINTDPHHMHLAIAGMDANLCEYNRGVLSMLGKADLAYAYTAAKATAEISVEARDKLFDDDDWGRLANTPAQIAAVEQARIDIEHAHKTWEPIQALIDASKPFVEEILQHACP